MLELTTPVQYVKGIGPRLAEILAAPRPWVRVRGGWGWVAALLPLYTLPHTTPA